MASRKATIVSLTGLAALIAAASVAAVMRRDPDPVVRTISVARGMGPPVDGQAGRCLSRCGQTTAAIALPANT